MNMVQVIGHCADLGYVIGITEFALCSTLADLVKLLRNQSDENDGNINSDIPVPSVLKLEELAATYTGKAIVCRKINDNYRLSSRIIISQDATQTSNLYIHFITQGSDTQPRI